MPLRGLVRSSLLGLAGFVLALGLIACGDDDEEPSGGADATAPAGARATGTASGASGGGTPTAEGNRIAREAMLVEADLPGTGWVVTQTDEFSGSLLDADPSEFSDSPACNAYLERVQDAAMRAEEARVGRASKSFTKTDSLLGTSVDVEVAVYEDDDVASDLVSDAKDAFDSDDFETCFSDVVKDTGAEIPKEVEFELDTADPRIDAPKGGVAQAFEVGFSAAGMTFELHAELYAWADDNATAFVSIFGDPDVVTAELVEAVVGKTEERLSAAQ
jgi:hypothetical protein